MKKVLLTLIAAVMVCGSVFAQYPSYWPDFTDGPYENQDGIVAAIIVDGHIITIDDEGWDALEVAPFVGEECRGNNMFLFDGVTTFGDLYPTLDGYPIFYNDQNEVVTFKMYDHANGVLYEDCEILYLGEPYVITTGVDHFEGWADPENPIFLSFTSSGITKDIVGYGETNNNYYLISSPVGSVNPTAVTNMLDETFDLYSFDQSQNAEEWRNYRDSNFVLEPGMGYLYAHDEDVTLTFLGSAMVDEGEGYNVPLSFDANANLAGWNLVGNPFNEPAIIDEGYPFYMMNEDGNDIILADGIDEIEPMQGVFVIAEGEGESVTFMTGAGSDPIVIGKEMVMNLNNGRSVKDRAIVRFGQGRQLPKFQLRTNSTKLYVPVDGTDYALVNSEEMGELPVNFKAESNGVYMLSFTFRNVEFGYLHLIDNKTGVDVDLLQSPSYSFEASTTDYASRFRLVFATGNATDNFAFFSNGSFVISNEGEATLQVVDVTGRVMSSESISGCANVHVNAAPGVYMLRLINGDNERVQKVVVE